MTSIYQNKNQIDHSRQQGEQVTTLNKNFDSNRNSGSLGEKTDRNSIAFTDITSRSSQGRSDKGGISIKSRAEWTLLSNSMVVHDEKLFTSTTEATVRLNYMIRERFDSNDSLLTTNSRLRKKFAQEEYRFVNWPEYKRFIRKVVKGRKDLSGMSAKNYNWKKYSIFLKREKFHGVDVLDEFE